MKNKLVIITLTLLFINTSCDLIHCRMCGEFNLNLSFWKNINDSFNFEFISDTNKVLFSLDNSL